MTPFDVAWNALGSPGFYATFVPIAVGAGLPHFKFWFTPEDEVKKRCRALCEIWNETVNERFVRLFEKLIELDKLSWRGSPPQQPDHVSEYTKEIFRIFTRRQLLTAIESRVAKWHGVVFGSLAFGLLCLIASFVLPQFSAQIAIACVAIVSVQTVAVFQVRNAVKELSLYEAEA